MPAEDEAIIRVLLERVADDVVHRASLQDRRRAEHAAVDKVGPGGVGIGHGDRLVRAREVRQDVGQAERATAGEDNGLDRVVDGDWEHTGQGSQSPFQHRSGRDRVRRTVVDDGRHLLAVERGSRVGEGREEDVLDVDADVVSKRVVVGVCTFECIIASAAWCEGRGHTQREGAHGSRCAET